jgi:uncharacterized protein
MNKKDPIVHFEIPADDVERAKKFYSETFGWEIEKFEMPSTGSTGGDPYYMVRTTETDENQMVKTPGAINGGLMKRKSKEQPFMNYISVESIEEKLDTVKANGGEILMPKTEIAPKMGWIAAFKDTEGNIMGLHEMSEKFKKETASKE